MTNNEGERLARIEQLCETMNARLFGNGQPGVITQFDSRLDLLERTEAKARGAFWMLSSLFTLLGGGTILHILRGK